MFRVSLFGLFYYCLFTCLPCGLVLRVLIAIRGFFGGVFGLGILGEALLLICWCAVWFIVL